MPEERRQYILSRLSQDGRVEVPALAEQCHASIETIRKDLILLEQRGLLQRVHGGALPKSVTQGMPPVVTGGDGDGAERSRLAHAALKLLASSQSVFLDASPACEAIAKAITTPVATTFITNGIGVASHLAPVAMTHLIGGVVHPGTGGTLGANALDQIYVLRPDWVVLEADAIGEGGEVFGNNLEIAKFKTILSGQGGQSMLLAEAAAFKGTGLATIGDLSFFDYLVTSSDVDEETRELIEAAGCEVIYA